MLCACRLGAITLVGIVVVTLNVLITSRDRLASAYAHTPCRKPAEGFGKTLLANSFNHVLKSMASMNGLVAGPDAAGSGVEAVSVQMHSVLLSVTPT